MQPKQRSVFSYFERGFDEYQERMYKAIAEKVLNLSGREILLIERQARKVDGLDSGLIHFIENPVFITNKMYNALADALNLEKKDYLPKPRLKEHELPGLMREAKITREEIEQYLIDEFLKESDKKSQELNAFSNLNMRPRFKKLV